MQYPTTPQLLSRAKKNFTMTNPIRTHQKQFTRNSPPPPNFLFQPLSRMRALLLHAFSSPPPHPVLYVQRSKVLYTNKKKRERFRICRGRKFKIAERKKKPLIEEFWWCAFLDAPAPSPLPNWTLDMLNRRGYLKFGPKQDDLMPVLKGSQTNHMGGGVSSTIGSHKWSKTTFVAVSYIKRWSPRFRGRPTTTPLSFPPTQSRILFMSRGEGGSQKLIVWLVQLEKKKKTHKTEILRFVERSIKYTQKMFFIMAKRICFV